MKRARQPTQKLRTYRGRVLRKLARFVGPLTEQQARLLVIARRIVEQQGEEHGKVYSVQAPEVACLAKGKAQKRYEVGCKVRVGTTNRCNWLVGIAWLGLNPEDGAPLRPALEQVEKLTGVKAAAACVDKGDRGSAHHPEEVAVHISGRKNLSRRLRKRLRRRSALEAVIGQTKHDHAMERNYLLGEAGERVNARLSGCAWNLKKLWRAFVENPRLCTTT